MVHMRRLLIGHRWNGDTWIGTELGFGFGLGIDRNMIGYDGLDMIGFMANFSV